MVNDDMLMAQILMSDNPELVKAAIALMAQVDITNTILAGGLWSLVAVVAVLVAKKFVG